MATRKLASSGNFNLLMKDVLAICVEAVGASGGTIYLHDAAACRLTFQHVLPEDVADRLPVKDIPDDFGMAGAAFQNHSTVCREFPEKPESDWNSFERATGTPVRSMVATPLMMEDETPIGVVQLLNKTDGCFDETDIAVLDIVAAVATMAYMNYRLTEESTRASTLLGMGKVGHDIGNLAASLYATLSFSDMAMTGLKDELQKQKPEPMVSMYVETLDPMFDDLKMSVDRIVGYSRLISDMSAGRALRPNKKVAPMATTIQTSAAYLATDARKHHVALRFEIDEEAPATLHDELYIFRIVQNLVGNAIKAVKETVPDDWVGGAEDDDDPPVYGEVSVRYAFENEQHLIEVSDTGPGMTRATAERILSGNARSQWDKGSGSGWGMKIVLELAQTHDGRVTIDSELGSGSTFRVAIPHCGD
ncbi:putative histidine kinase [Fimbriimonas ginsengisoli Gsoil 348]|uniref:histidine kinase n=2 Tax=Fimbriimonas ginsengisoli TaxID=1005039 RepID=A0A068NXG6_FIMGI|nr:putative histidine kinase [Fimbriimonas ginsengisoli Gsoil 348]